MSRCNYLGNALRNGLTYSLAPSMPLGGARFWSLEPKVHMLRDRLWLAFTTAATVG